MRLLKWQQKPVAKFILTTLFYFSVMIVLLLLYDYIGIDQAQFLYNEF